MPTALEGRSGSIAKAGEHRHSAGWFGLRSGVSLHFLEDSGLLFDADAGKLYSLNTTATFIWCQLQERAGVDQIVLQLMSTFGLRGDAARDYLDAILRQWRDLGLLEAADASPTSPAVAQPRAGGAAQVYQVLDLRFRLVASAGDRLGSLTPLLEPLAVAAKADDAEPVDLADRPGAVALRIGGRAAGTCARGDQIVPMFKAGLVQRALEHSRDFCAIHAAGIALHGGCLLLPGVSGSGKSTLAAALVASGQGLFGDDTIVLARDTLDARPIPFAICLKAGAWDILRPSFPLLERLPTWRRPDGKSVRYLVPPERSRWIEPGRRERVRWIVFPRRTQDAGAELVPLARAESLSRLFAECCFLESRLDSAKVERLVDWISRIECFEMRFASLDGAVQRLLRLAA